MSEDEVPLATAKECLQALGHAYSNVRQAAANALDKIRGKGKP